MKATHAELQLCFSLHVVRLAVIENEADRNHARLPTILAHMHSKKQEKSARMLPACIRPRD